MAAFIPLAISALGGYLKNRSANKKAEAAAKAQQPYQQRANNKDAAKAHLAAAIAKAYGVEGSAGPGVMEGLGTPLQATGYDGAGTGSGMFGDALAGIGSGMAANQSSGMSFEDFMAMQQGGGPVGAGPSATYNAAGGGEPKMGGGTGTGDFNYDPQVGGPPSEFDDDDPNSPWYRGPR